MLNGLRYNGELRWQLELMAAVQVLFLLLHHLDLIISVDTAIAHLAGAMGKPLWIPLNNYAVDWRYLLNTSLHPWYSSARIFRQPAIGDWGSVLQTMQQFLDKVKI